MITDREELSNFNVVISGFLNRGRTEYTYIRTEPFIHAKKKNFDLLIASPDDGIVVFVEHERTLASGTDEKVEKFGGRREFFESGGDTDLDTNEYLRKVLGTEAGAADFVLSSQHTPQDRLEAAAQRKGEDFCVWDLGDNGVTCSIHYYPVKQDKKAPFKGHTEDDLEAYIFDVLTKRVPKQDYLSFTFSSSKFLKLKHMAIVLVTRHHSDGNETFRYDDWERLFAEQDIDLNNYLLEERQSVYENFIAYGRSCDVVKLEEDVGELLKNRYRIKSSATTDIEKLTEEIEKKMAERRMVDDYGERVDEVKKQVLEEIQPTEETTLSDFVDRD